MYENEIVPEEFDLGFSISQNSEKDKQDGTYMFGMGVWCNYEQTWADILCYLIRWNKGNDGSELINNLIDYCNTEFMYSKNKTILYLMKHNINVCSIYDFDGFEEYISENLEENEMVDEDKVDDYILIEYTSKIIEIIKKAKNITDVFYALELLLSGVDEDICGCYRDKGFIKKE